MKSPGIMNRVWYRIWHWAYGFYWTPTREEVKRVATHYGLSLETFSIARFERPMRFLPFYFPVAGFVSKRRKVIGIQESDYRILWHEIGHLHCLQWLMNEMRSLLFGAAVILNLLAMAELCDGRLAGVTLGSFFGFTIFNELVAHFIVGLPRSKKWLKQLRG